MPTYDIVCWIDDGDEDFGDTIVGTTKSYVSTKTAYQNVDDAVAGAYRHMALEEAWDLGLDGTSNKVNMSDCEAVSEILQYEAHILGARTQGKPELLNKVLEEAYNMTGNRIKAWRKTDDREQDLVYHIGEDVWISARLDKHTARQAEQQDIL